MGSGVEYDQEEKWEKWEALAGDACPGTEDSRGKTREAAKAGPDPYQREASGRTVTLLVSFGGILGLGLGITFALLLVNGELDLSLKDIKSMVRTLRTLTP